MGQGAFCVNTVCSQHYDLYRVLVESSTKIDGIVENLAELKSLVHRVTASEERETATGDKIDSLIVSVERLLPRICEVEKEVFVSKRIIERRMATISVSIASCAVIANIILHYL